MFFHSGRWILMLRKLMLRRKAASNFENINDRTASRRYHQLAAMSDSRALLKSILVEMYQKHRAVMAIFRVSFRHLLRADSFFSTAISASGGIQLIYLSVNGGCKSNSMWIQIRVLLSGTIRFL